MSPAAPRKRQPFSASTLTSNDERAEGPPKADHGGSLKMLLITRRSNTRRKVIVPSSKIFFTTVNKETVPLHRFTVLIIPAIHISPATSAVGQVSERSPRYTPGR